MLRFSQKVFSSKVYQNVFEPMIGDFEEEYFEALNEERISDAKWVRWRFTFTFWFVLFFQIMEAPVRILKLVKELRKNL